MKFTLSWLKQHLETEIPVEQICDRLSLIGLEVDTIMDNAAIFKDFTIAQIVDAQKHPNADKLQICKVDTSKEILQIVCGAPNARAGIKVVLAPVGSVIPVGEFKIKKSKIRDVESNGMLCSERELGLGDDHNGIIELNDNAVIGTSFAQYQGLDDVVIDIELTPNRGDAASVYGIARDLCAAGIGDLIKHEEPSIQATGQFISPITARIEDPENCHHAVFRYFKNVQNSKCADGVSQYLRAIGSSEQSAIVDISNFAMFSYGRPNHAYDADKIEDDVVIRKSQAGEKFIALGGEEYELPQDLSIIADSKKVIAIAGVMGGELTKIDPNTKNILFELAYFNPRAVMKAGRALNIITDSRFRFERNIDASTTEFFLQYFSEMLIKYCSGEASEPLYLKGETINQTDNVVFSINDIKRIAGISIPKEQVETILQKLGFQIISSQNNDYSLTIPAHRKGDIAGRADIIEEVLRIHGYDNVNSISVSGHKNSKASYKDKARGLLLERGLHEVITWSFMCSKIAAQFGFESNIEIQNPISIQMNVMRQTIIPNLLNALINNANRDNLNLCLFEAGAVYGRQTE